MKKLDKLIEEQKQKISEYREHYFGMATSTEPGDKKIAEKAAVRLAEIGGLENCVIKHVSNPQDGDSLSDSLRGSLSDSLWDSLSDSLRGSLCDSLRDSLSDSLRGSLCDSLWDSLRGSLSDSLWGSLSDSLWDSLSDSLRGSLCDSLRDSLSDSLRGSLCDSLWDSLNDSLRDSFWYSLWDSLSDSSWTAFYSYAVKVLGIECSEEHKELLSLYRDIAQNCTAIWLLPGAVIICEKPVSVDIKEGKLVSIEWGK